MCLIQNLHKELRYKHGYKYMYTYKEKYINAKRNISTYTEKSKLK